MTSLSYYQNNYKNLILSEKEEFFTRFPDYFKSQNSEVLNDFYILKKPQKKEAYNKKREYVINTNLTEAQLHQFLESAPELYMAIKTERERVYIYRNYSSFTPQEIEQHRAQHPDVIKTLERQEKEKTIEEAIKNKTLLPHIVDTGGSQKNNYLKLVVEQGQQIKEYFDKYPQEFVEVYKKSVQHPETQKFMLGQSAQLVFFSAMEPQSKIDFISEHKAVLDNFMINDYPHQDKEVERFCFHQIYPTFNQKPLRQVLNFFIKKPNFLKLLNYHHPEQCHFLLSQRFMDLNVAQVLYKQLETPILISDLLYEKLEVRFSDLIATISFEQHLYEQKLFQKIINLHPEKSEVNFYASAAYQVYKKSGKLTDKLQVRHLDYLLRLDSVASDKALTQEISVLREKMLLNLQIETAKTASERFKL